jgi:hypothetical protein
MHSVEGQLEARLDVRVVRTGVLPKTINKAQQ